MPSPSRLLYAFAGGALALLSGCEEPSITSGEGIAGKEGGPTPPPGMVWIPGGTYARGEDRKVSEYAEYPEEKPVHAVTVDGFFIDTCEVTNAQFLEFTEATGYQTRAEQGWSPDQFPKAPPGSLSPGAMVFTPPEHKVEVWRPGAEWSWWKFVAGASWRHPEGPDSSIEERMDHPVVCVTQEDARAYAKWADKRLPTEAEWELAARGGLELKVYAWGDERTPGGKWLANVFQGTFPSPDTGSDGFIGTAPVKSYPPNPFGLYDMAGNVWEHCSDYFRPDYYKVFARDPHPNPQGPDQAINDIERQWFLQHGSYRAMAETPPAGTELHAVKGGSYLCHDTYCLRFRPAARHHSEGLSPTNHTGFRCVRSAESP